VAIAATRRSRLPLSWLLEFPSAGTSISSTPSLRIERYTDATASPAPGGLGLVAWAAALSVLGTAVAIRRDVDW